MSTDSPSPPPPPAVPAVLSATGTGRPPPASVDPTFRRVLVFFLLIIAVLVAVVVVSIRNLNRSIATSDWVNHTHAVIAEANAIVAGLDTAEGSLRTFLLTGDNRDHAAYRDAYSALAEHVDVARALTRQEPSTAEQFARIESLLQDRADFARSLVRAKQSGSAEALQKLLATDADRTGVSDIRRLMQRLTLDQTNLLTTRDRAAFQQAETTRWTVITGLILDLMLLAGAAWLIRDDLAARRRAAAILAEANEQLEAKVRERTAELEAKNEALIAQNLEDRWAHQALEHQLRYNQLIINSIADLVLVVTKLVNVSRINPAVTYLTGFDSAELIDVPLSRVVRLAPGAPAAASPVADPIARALQDGRDLRDQPAIITGKTGREVAVHFNLYPLRDRDKVVGGVVILQSPPANPAAGA